MSVQDRKSSFSISTKAWVPLKVRLNWGMCSKVSLWTSSLSNPLYSMFKIDSWHGWRKFDTEKFFLALLINKIVLYSCNKIFQIKRITYSKNLYLFLGSIILTQKCNFDHKEEEQDHDHVFLIKSWKTHSMSPNKLIGRTASMYSLLSPGTSVYTQHQNLHLEPKLVSH